MWRGWRNTRRCKLPLALPPLHAATLHRDSTTTLPLSVHQPSVRLPTHDMDNPLSTTRYGRHSHSSSDPQVVRRSTARRLAFTGQATGSSQTSILVRRRRNRRTARQMGSIITVPSSHLLATAAMPSNIASRPRRHNKDPPMPPPNPYNSFNNAHRMQYLTRPVYQLRSKPTAHLFVLHHRRNSRVIHHRRTCNHDLCISMLNSSSSTLDQDEQRQAIRPSLRHQSTAFSARHPSRSPQELRVGRRNLPRLWLKASQMGMPRDWLIKNVVVPRGF